MLSHVSLGVRDLERSRIFYDAVITALGFERVWTGGRSLSGNACAVSDGGLGTPLSEWQCLRRLGRRTRNAALRVAMPACL